MTGSGAPAATGAASSSGKAVPKSGGSSKSLHSFPVPTATEDVEREEADEEVHRDEECSIKVCAGGLGWVGWVGRDETGLGRGEQGPGGVLAPGTLVAKCTPSMQAAGTARPGARDPHPARSRCLAHACRSRRAPASCATSRPPPPSACPPARSSSRSSATQASSQAACGTPEGGRLWCQIYQLAPFARHAQVLLLS